MARIPADGHDHVHDHEGHTERNQSIGSSKTPVRIPIAIGEVERDFQSPSIPIRDKDQPEESNIAKAKSDIPQGSGNGKAARSIVKTEPDSIVSDITSTPFYPVGPAKSTGIKRAAAQRSQTSTELSQALSRDATSEEIDKTCPCALLGHTCTKGN